MPQVNFRVLFLPMTQWSGNVPQGVSPVTFMTRIPDVPSPDEPYEFIFHTSVGEVVQRFVVQPATRVDATATELAFSRRLLLIYLASSKKTWADRMRATEEAYKLFVAHMKAFDSATVWDFEAGAFNPELRRDQFS